MSEYVYYKLNYFKLQAYLGHVNIRVDSFGGAFIVLWHAILLPTINPYVTGPFGTSQFSV